MRNSPTLCKQYSLRTCLLILFFFPLALLAAQKQVTLRGESITMKQAIEQIERNSDYTFFYTASDLKESAKKNFNVKGSIDEVLKELFGGSRVNYVVKGNEVILSVKKAEAQQQQQQQQKRVIKGQVIDGETKEPIIGANIWLKNSSTGTVTDFDGNYSITVTGVGGVLEFTYIGMKKQELVIGNQTTMNVTLLPDSETLDEVVVVGYGSQKKESVVGAISTLDVGKLNVSGASISTALAGQLSGVVAVTRSGEPGKSGAADFYIRGVSSFKGTSKPLVLVDGIERDLDLVDTEDIASFSILKDASASAVYGVRGANGVILITTKKGVEGKPRLNLRTEFGMTSPTRMPEFANSAQWAELYNEASGTQYYSAEVIEKYRNGSDPDLYPNVNWIDELYRDFAYNKKVNLSVSGGGEIAKY